LTFSESSFLSYNLQRPAVPAEKGEAMTHTRFGLIRSITVIAALLGFAGAVAAQTPPAPTVKRNIVLKEDTSIPGREGVMAFVELAPGAAEGRHTHPAEVFVFVLEGSVSFEYEGSPTVTLKAGDVFHVGQGKIHQATNNGTGTAKLAAVFIAEKGKPLTTPVK
jgi:quercetin dioxygenase-like cupin family protein